MTVHTHKTPNPWALVLKRLKTRLDEYNYINWFSQTRFRSLEGNRLEIEVPSQYFAKWLRDHYMAEINACVEEVLEQSCEVVLQPAEETPTPPSSNGRANGHAVATPVKQNDQARRQPKAPPKELTTRYTFDRFVVAASNRFAHAASRAVAENPGNAYNPLFLYGGTGLGKTHLMHAMGHEILRHNPQARVVLVSSEIFMNQLIEGIRQKATESFRNRYRKADILLIDDIHFIAGKEATQEEFFHTFNALFDMRKQIVISSDRQPKEISGLEARLISRFEWGLVTDIQAPDLETRVAILQSKAADEGAVVPAEVLRYIATYITNNIRELEGALIRVMAFSKLTKEAITMEMVEAVLGELIGRDHIKPITFEAVQRAVGDHFDVRLSDMRGSSREAHVTRPRHIAMYLCKHLIPTMSLNEIGEAFGGRDHTTVIHACKKITKCIDNELDTRHIVNHLEKTIRNG